MASKVFNQGKENIFSLDLTAATIKVLLLMTNTTAIAQNDGISATTDFTTLDECDGTGYAQQTLTTKTITKDDVNDRSKFDAADVTFTALGASTRSIAGALLVWDNAGTLRPLSWHEYDTPRIADGTDFVLEWRADTGIILAV